MRNKRPKFSSNEEDADIFEPPKLTESSDEKVESFSWLKRWRKGDDVFKGKYSAGITPKVPARPVQKLKAPIPKLPFGERKDSIKNGISLFNNEISSIFAQERVNNLPSNPYVSLTPQIVYPKRKISFNEQGLRRNEDLCYSPESTKTKIKWAETPWPMKTMLWVPKSIKS